MPAPSGPTLDDKRQSVIINAGPIVPQLPAKDFFARFIPKTHITPKQLQSIKTRVTRTACHRGRWLAFPLDPNNNSEPEDVAFLGFVDIANAVHDAAVHCVPRLKATTTFDNIPDTAPETSNRPNKTRPDGVFVSVAPHSMNTENPHWVDIAATGEYKKNGTSKKLLTDDIQKALWNMHHTMREDASRRFTFAFTVENCTMRIWFASRSEIVVSSSFDFMKDKNHLVQFFLAFMFASRENLGWDPTMKSLWNGVVGSPFQYDITVRDTGTGEERVYRTKELVSEVGADHIRGRGTRVWKVNEVLANGALSPEIRVLKDAWIDSDRVCEGKVMDDILGSTEDPKLKAELEAILLTKETHGNVYINGAVDHTIDGPSREKYIKHSKLFFSLKHVSPNPTPTPSPNPSAETSTPVTLFIDMPVGSCRDPPAPKPEEAVVEPVYYHSKVHYRIVFEEACEPLFSVRSLRRFLFLLMKTCLALQKLHRVGWVHRDISSGNILISGDEVKLGDLEYAKRVKHDEPPHAGIRTGTEDFMSVEVRNQRYYFAGLKTMPVESFNLTTDELSRVRDTTSSAQNLEYVIPKPTSAIRGWFYNPLHDMESVLWLFSRQLLFQDHYLQWVHDDTGGQQSAERQSGSVAPLTTETTEGRNRRVAAYYVFGHSLFVSRTNRLDLIQNPRCLPDQLDYHHLHPVVHWLGGVLAKMRTDLADEYVKHEADMTKIDHSCADELHLKFANDLAAARAKLAGIEGSRFQVMTRSLQAEMEMLQEQARMAAKAAAPSSVLSESHSSKRSREESDEDEDEEAISHPSKSPRTEANQSPRRSPIEAVALPRPSLAPGPVIPVTPAAPAIDVAPAVLSEEPPKRRAAVVPPSTRTLRSHARKEVKLESIPPPVISPPPAAAHARKTASTAARANKAAKNNEAVRAAAKVAAKIKTRSRKGR